MSDKRREFNKVQSYGIATGLGVALILGMFFLTIESDKIKNRASSLTFWKDALNDTAEGGEPAADLTEPYESTRYGFTLYHPEGFKVEHYDEGEGSGTIVFEGRTKAEDFQIFVNPVEEGGIGLVTPEAINSAFPHLPIISPQYVVVTDAVKGTLFWSESANLGQTRELWMAYKGHLYQITTRAENDTNLAHMMSTWQFTR